MCEYIVIAERNKKNFTICLMGEWDVDLGKALAELIKFKRVFSCSGEEDHIKMRIAVNSLYIEYEVNMLYAAFIECSLKEIEKMCKKYITENPKAGKVQGSISSLREGKADQ